MWNRVVAIKSINVVLLLQLSLSLATFTSCEVISGTEPTQKRDTHTLVPWKPLEFTVTPGQSVTLGFAGVGAEEMYEIRLSYPATTPADFVIHMSDLHGAHNAKGRELRNTEKHIFWTPTQPNIETFLDHSEVIIDCQRLEAVAHTGQMQRSSVTYTVVLARLHYGLPEDSFVLVGGVSICIALALFLAPRMGRWVATGKLPTTAKTT